MKAGWQSKPFENCIEKVAYTTKIQRKDFLDAGAFPIVSQEEAFINGYWDEAADIFRIETPLVVFGDHTKVLKYIDFDFVLGADGVKLLPPKEFLVPKFFYYQLHTAQLDSLGYARHYKLLKELEIKYPDRAEQHRIVAILDEAFDGIATAKANAEKNLQNARALFESHLQSVFTQPGEGWVDVRLGDICDRVSVGHVGPTSEFYCDEGTGIRFLRSQNVRRGYLDWSGVQYVTPEFHRQLRKSQLQVGDLLFVRVGANRGDCCSVPEGVGELNCANIVFARPTRGNASYLERYCQSPQGRAQLLGMTTGSAQGVINTSSVAELVLPLPPEQEQITIVWALRELECETQRLESLYQQKLTALDDLKKSLLHQAFSGQL